MLISTLKRYVEVMGGKLNLVAEFPNRPPVLIERIAEHRSRQKQPAKGARTVKSPRADVA